MLPPVWRDPERHLPRSKRNLVQSRELSAVTDAQQLPGFQSARAKIKVMVKRILRRNGCAATAGLSKHGYPPDLQDEAVKTVLAQAELLCADWVEIA